MSTPPGDPKGPAHRPEGGLWSGMLQRWGFAAPQAPPPAPAVREGAYSREALQSMIDRKRRNDLERRREFQFLRTLRRNEGARSERAPAAPSVLFHSSISSSRNERVTTLRKIDEIEAQMSGQWTRLNARLQLHSEADESAVPLADRASLQAGPGVPDAPLAPVAAPTETVIAVPAPHGPFIKQTGAADVQAFVHDPELEEAALCFAQGNMEGAQAALLALLAPGHPQGTRPETWHVLFDFYRATGQQDRYDAFAADFAVRFNCSPPQWRRLSDPLVDGAGEPDAIASAFPACVAGEASPHWSCPVVLDRAAALTLRDLLPTRAQPWCLSWSDLSCIEPDALHDLAALVAHWVAQPLKLRLAGIERLERAIDTRMVRGDRQVPAAWWILRMDLLRAIGHCEAFELVALDYCITYEVSPPSWEPPRCDVRLLAPETAAAGDTSWLEGGDGSQLQVSALAGGDLSSLFAAAPVGELSGVLLGDPSAVLARLDSRLSGAESVVISCARLERIDFEAAGALLNWVAARHAQGHSVHLTDLHRVVAVLLGSMGLGAQAQLTLRRD